MKPTKLHLLGELCSRGAASGAPVKATTIDLARALRVSQQTVSRWLDELEREKLIQRDGKKARLSKHAVAEIESLAKALEAKTAPSKEKMVLRGVVVKGLGEGAKFLSLPGYARQLREALGWTPFPGTLNLKLDAKSAAVKKRLELMSGLAVKSFVKRNQRFGSVKLFYCAVKAAGRNEREERGAVILPEKSFYGEGVLEVIAPPNLRKKLDLRDRSLVQVEILEIE